MKASNLIILMAIILVMFVGFIQINQTAIESVNEQNNTTDLGDNSTEGANTAQDMIETISYPISISLPYVVLVLFIIVAISRINP
jgi:uncharacterized protein (UPF0333 family)